MATNEMETSMIEYDKGLMANMKFNLMGAELNLGILKEASGTRTYIFQDIQEKPEGVAVSKLIEDVKKLLGQAGAASVDGLDSKIKGQLEVVAKPDPAAGGKAFSLDAVKIVLRTVYLNIFKPDAGETSYQYAFRVDVHFDGFLPGGIESFDVEQLTLAIWQLEKDNSAIRKQLAIPDLSQTAVAKK